MVTCTCELYLLYSGRESRSQDEGPRRRGSPRAGTRRGATLLVRSRTEVVNSSLAHA